MRILRGYCHHTNSKVLQSNTSATTTVKGKELTAFSYTYDKAGRMVEEKSRDAIGALDKKYTYDDCGKLTKYEEAGNTNKTIAYTYDLFGNRTGEAVTEGGKTKNIAYTYDASDRLQTKKEDGKTTGRYTYDKDGNLIEKVEDGVTTDYTYTTDNRMATVTVDGTLKQAVRYDGNGLKTFEVLRKEYDATAVSEETLENNKKQLQQWKKYYEEESENRTAGASSKNREDVDLTQTLISGHDYDEDAYFVAGVVGIMAPPLWQEWCDFAASFGEDFENTIHLFVDGKDKKDDACEDVGKTTEDRAFANLLGKVDKPEKIGRPYNYKYAVYEPTAYVYDLTQENAQVLLQYASPTDAKATDAFSYGVSGRTSSDTAGVYVYDGRGSVSETVAKSKVTSTLRYDPYGEITTGAPVQDTIYAYNGEQYTPQTGLIYLRARNYDPTTGTFTSKDTYLGDKLEPVTRNRYTYANNNPVSYQDPSGHKAKKSSIVAAVRSGAAAVKKTVSKATPAPVRTQPSTPKTAAKAVQKAVLSSVTKQATSTAKKAVATAKRTVQTSRNPSSQRIVNQAKATVVSATTAVINRANGMVASVVQDQRNTSSGEVDCSSVAETIALAKETIKYYIPSKVRVVRPGKKFSLDEALREMHQNQQDISRMSIPPSEYAQSSGEWWIVDRGGHFDGRALARKTDPIQNATRQIKDYLKTNVQPVLKSAFDFFEKGSVVFNNMAEGVGKIVFVAAIGAAAAGTAETAAAIALPILAAAGLGALIYGGVYAFNYHREHGSFGGMSEGLSESIAIGFNETAGIAGLLSTVAGSWRGILEAGTKAVSSAQQVVYTTIQLIIDAIEDFSSNTKTIPFDEIDYSSGEETGNRLALGLSEYLDSFAQLHNATTWKDFSNPLEWQNGVLDALNDSTTEIVFNLDGIDNPFAAIQRASGGYGGATDWELMQIYNNPESWGRITWYRDGSEVPNPFR